MKSKNEWPDNFAGLLLTCRDNFHSSWVRRTNKKTFTMTTKKEYIQDGPEAQRIASFLPYDKLH